MKIILTIKSILNYLYNNLIDLIYVKKVKFEDGTEMITAPKSSFSLFDIKIMSQKIAQKDWSCISYPTQNKLNKSDVPTVYNVLKDKLDNVEKSSTGWQNSTQSYVERVYFNSKDGYYYWATTSGIYKSKNIDLSNGINVITENANITNFSLCIINSKVYYFVYVLSLYCNIYNENYEKIKDLLPIGEVSYPPTIVIGNKAFPTNLFSRVIDNIRYIGISYYEFTQDDIEVKELILMQNNYQYWSTVCNLGNYLYFTENDTQNLYEYNVETQSLSVYPITNLPRRPADTLIGVYNNKIVLLMSYSMNAEPYIRIWQLESDKTFTTLYSYDGRYGVFGSPNFAGTSEGRSVWQVGEEYYFCCGVNAIDTLFKTTDFNTFTSVYQAPQNKSIRQTCISPKNDIALNISTTMFVYNGYAPTVYTDTINGIDIKYYKSDNWKICTPNIAVGNDDNLQAVYEYLGYINYWWIDDINEQISLQRNSNFLAFMYVGDDYVDTLLPDGIYNNVRLMPEVREKISQSTVNIDIKANVKYVFENVETFTIDTCEDSPLETIIILKTGNSITFTDDSSLAWINGLPTLSANTTYMIKIVNQIAECLTVA